MNDYKQIVEALREECEWAEQHRYILPILLPEHLAAAIDAIEKLADALNLNKDCSNCEYVETAFKDEPCFSCDNKSNWKLRSVKECGY